MWKAALAGVLVLAGTIASAEPVRRSNWIPGQGEIIGEDQPTVGDMWLFNCPKGGRLKVGVDTLPIGDATQAGVEPVMVVLDGAGDGVIGRLTLFTCLFGPRCNFGWECQILEADCGRGERHAIIVVDSGQERFEDVEQDCIGGTYEVELEVWNAAGQALEAQRVRLGGGPKRAVPRWLGGEAGVGREGPLLDDEGLPRR